MSAMPVWVELVVAGLLVASGILVLVSAFGFLRLKSFFLRMHPPALAYTLGNWCVAGAGVLWFSVLDRQPVLHPLLIPVLLTVTVPVTTVLLARVALFRQRIADADAVASHLPPPTGAGDSTRDAQGQGRAAE